jgi:hypothetical protein
MRAAPLAAFVFGVCVLQWQAELPPNALLWWLLGASVVCCVLALRVPAGAPA